MRWKRYTWIGLAVLAVSAGICPAWHGPGHIRATGLAGQALPKDMPGFFTAGLKTVAHCSVDPDLFRLRANPELRDGEVPEHFIDLELLAGEKLPRKRSEFIALCRRRKLDPAKVGYLPYAVVEWTQRLTIALAEHRRWPDNLHIRTKCLVYAGILSHYAQDACQPLHTTIHYDGRAKPDGSSPRTGVHAKVDALLHKAPAPAAKIRPTVCKDLFAAVVARIRRSHALVGKVYEIGRHFPDVDAPLPADSPAAGFATERLKACADFTASLYLTAWRNAAKVELPEWHKRPTR
ncbi:MAG: phospholipase C/P1 nuclease family protein [Planctomycetota bacterium]|jgi:hypothetical protein